MINKIMRRLIYNHGHKRNRIKVLFMKVSVYNSVSKLLKKKLEDQGSIE